MNIVEIPKRFNEIERRLKSLEGTQHSHDEPQPEQTVEQLDAEQENKPEPEAEEDVGGEIELQPETESEVESEDRFPDDRQLSALVSLDVYPFSAADVANAIMNHPQLRDARELVMKPETGVMEKMQSFRFTDGTFMVPSRETFQRLVAETKIDEVEWVKEVSDCEDICLRFNARCIELGINSCGRIMSWSGGHCFIIAIVRDGDSLGFAFLEPQTDKFLTDEVGEGRYALDNCLIIIN